MANTATLSKKRNLDAFEHLDDHKGFQAAGCWNQKCVLVPKENSANGKSLAEPKVSAPCQTQHSGLMFNRSTSVNGIRKSNPLADLPPCRSVEHSDNDDKVDETIKIFHKVLSDLRRRQRQDKENNISSRTFELTREAAIILQKQGKWLNIEKRLGTIPGVGVYKEFQYRAELRVIGLHCQFQDGIDYMMINGQALATSIVDSGRYLKLNKTIDSTVFSSLDSLIYHGAGGLYEETKPKDQMLVRGNRALNNSMKKKNPVRVILKKKESSKSYKFVYVGLYLVDSCQSVRSEMNRKLVFKFLLTRQSGNHTNGCDCSKGCLDSEDCLCKIRNGGIHPYNKEGRLVNPMPLIIECGRSCKCSESCPNRVSQRLSQLQHERGRPMFELEKFRTRLGFMGVRPRCFIPKGSFVCKYEEEGIARLINISSSPNLFAQKVLYGDHEEESRPHVMLFAKEDIYHMKELTIRESLRKTIILFS